MTGLDHRGVKRQTNTLEPVFRRKPLIVLLEAGGRMLRIKVKGERRWYSIPFDEIYRLGVRIRAVELKAEKLARKKARQQRGAT